MKIMSPVKKYWYSLSDKIRFVIIGCINASIMYSIYTAFIVLLGDKFYQYALALAWFFSSMVSFFTHKYFVFHSRGKIFNEYIKCCCTWGLSYLINAFLLEILVKYVHLNVFISQIIAPAIAGIFTYFVFRKYAFKL